MSLVDIERLHGGPDYMRLPTVSPSVEPDESRCSQHCAIIKKIPLPYAAIFVFFATYYGYAIKALSHTQYTEEEHECVYSGLWVYLLLSLISNTSLVYVRQLVSSSYDEQYVQRMICGNAVMSFYRVGFFAWGTSELFSSGCKQIMHGTLLYNICGVQYVMDMVMLGGLFFHSGYIIPLLLANSRQHSAAIKNIREMGSLGSSGEAAEDASHTRSVEV